MRKPSAGLQPGPSRTRGWAALRSSAARPSERWLVNSYGQVSGFTLDRNLYWNAGSELPSSGAPTPADDAHAIVADPGLPAPTGAVVLPRWDPDKDQKKKPRFLAILTLSRPYSSFFPGGFNPFVA